MHSDKKTRNKIDKNSALIMFSAILLLLVFVRKYSQFYWEGLELIDTDNYRKQYDFLRNAGTPLEWMDKLTKEEVSLLYRGNEYKNLYFAGAEITKSEGLTFMSLIYHEYEEGAGRVIATSVNFFWEKKESRKKWYKKDAIEWKFAMGEYRSDPYYFERCSVVTRDGESRIMQSSNSIDSSYPYCSISIPVFTEPENDATEGGYAEFIMVPGRIRYISEEGAGSFEAHYIRGVKREQKPEERFTDRFNVKLLFGKSGQSKLRLLFPKRPM